MLPSLRTLSSVGKMTQTSAAKQPRALVFGLGAIGGIYAAILKRSNVCDVSIVARSTYDGVKKHGLRFNSEKHGNEVAQFGENVFRDTKEAAASGSFDYVLCANKALLDAKPSLAELISPVIGPETAIVLLQNGVGNEVPLHAAFPKNTILSAVVWTGGRVVPTTDGSVEVAQFAREGLTIGVDHAEGADPEQEKAQLDRFVDILHKGGSTDTVTTDDIQSARWVKVIWNCAWNSLTAVTRVRTNHIFGSSEGAADLSVELMKEVTAVAKAKGLNIPDGTPEKLLNDVQVVPGPGLPSSMMMDNEAGRPMEVEVILGTPVREGKRLGVPVPILTTLYTVMKALDWRNAHRDEADM